MKKIYVVLLLILAAFTLKAQNELPGFTVGSKTAGAQALSTFWAAKTVFLGNGRSNFTPVRKGAIIYDTLSNKFMGWNGAWIDLGLSSNTDTSFLRRDVQLSYTNIFLVNDSTFRLIRHDGTADTVVYHKIPGSGGVSSVALSLPASLLTVSGSPVTSTGTLTGSLTNATAYTLWGRGASTGAPSYLPSIDSNWIPPLHSENYYNTKYLQSLQQVNTVGNYSNLSMYVTGTSDTSILGTVIDQRKKFDSTAGQQMKLLSTFRSNEYGKIYPSHGIAGKYNFEYVLNFNNAYSRPDEIVTWGYNNKQGAAERAGEGAFGSAFENNYTDKGERYEWYATRGGYTYRWIQSVPSWTDSTLNDVTIKGNTFHVNPPTVAEDFFRSDNGYTLFSRVATAPSDVTQTVITLRESGKDISLTNNSSALLFGGADGYGFSNHTYPLIANSYDLGIAGAPWRNLYVTSKVGIGTTTLDSMLNVTQGIWVKRGGRFSGLPTGVGTKAVRIDAAGNLSTADTTAADGTPTNGSGTTANGTAVDIGGALTSNGIINTSGSNFIVRTGNSHQGIMIDGGTEDVTICDIESVGNGTLAKFSDANRLITLNASSGTVISQQHQYGIDLSGGGGDVILTTCGIKEVVVGDLSNRLILPDPTVVPEQTIEIYMLSTIVTALQATGGSTIYDKTNTAIATFTKGNYSLTSVNGNWRQK